MKRNDLRHELEQREQQLKEAFIQKVKDKEAELKETEKQVGQSRADGLPDLDFFSLED